MYMPTWPRPLKNKRSPGARSPCDETRVPDVQSAPVKCGRPGCPARAYAHETRPEQSKPPGAAPPGTYGVPNWLSARLTAPAPADEGAGRAAAAASPSVALTPPMSLTA